MLELSLLDNTGVSLDSAEWDMLILGGYRQPPGIVLPYVCNSAKSGRI